jgi:hypothetical protein
VWVVERYLSAPVEERLAELVGQTQSAVGAIRALGVEIAYLGSTLIPEEETCFCTFSGDCRPAVELLNRLVDAPSVRIVDALLAACPAGSQQFGMGGTPSS